MNQNRGVSARVLRLIVAGVFAAVCYSAGFNAGYDEGQGRMQRRQMQRMTDEARAAGAASAVDPDRAVADAAARAPRRNAAF